jgi:hypothetical protein
VKYYKRNYTETITRFNKDWTAIDWYYFEVDYNDYATKQMQITYEGKVFKYDTNNLEDENGGLAEGVLEVEDYILIGQEEFFQIWNKEFSNTYLVKELKFDNYWKFAWYNIDYNKTEQELCEGNQILCGTYKDIFLLDIEFSKHSNYLCYRIDEGSAYIKYGTVDNWDELVNCVQRWIDYIEQNAAIIYSSKPEAEKIERPLKILMEEHLQEALFSTYRNVDWDIEKFRGAYLSIGENNYSVINTYIGVEDLLVDLQKSLPKNMFIQACMFCKYSHYNVAGNDNYGDLNCFKHCKEKNTLVGTKQDIIKLFESDYTKSVKVEETYYCNEYKNICDGDYVYKKKVN